MPESLPDAARCRARSPSWCRRAQVRGVDRGRLAATSGSRPGRSARRACRAGPAGPRLAADLHRSTWPTTVGSVPGALLRAAFALRRGRGRRGTPWLPAAPPPVQPGADLDGDVVLRDRVALVPGDADRRVARHVSSPRSPAAAARAGAPGLAGRRWAWRAATSRRRGRPRTRPRAPWAPPAWSRRRRRRCGSPASHGGGVGPGPTMSRRMTPAAATPWPGRTPWPAAAGRTRRTRDLSLFRGGRADMRV